MDFYKLVSFFSTIITFSKVFVNSTECTDSAVTARKVKSCPKNVKEWNEAATRKGCEQMSHSCNSSSFDYHCVINAWGNETIEVCAPRSVIVGNVCAEYNLGGKRIQRNDNVRCKKCPPHYFSNESYKYQECYEYVKNANFPQKTQLSTDSTDMESTKQEIGYSSSSLTPNEESARPFQNNNAPKTSSHIIIITICVFVGLAAIAVVFTVKQRSWADAIFAHFRRAVLQSEDLTIQQSDIETVIGSVEEGFEVKTILLDEIKHTCIQDEYHELNESSYKTSLNAISN